MRNGSGYNTKQKENILAFLKSSGDCHKNVREISDYLASNGTPVGTATIYRQLEKLMAEGLVRKFTVDDKTGACFQYTGRDGGCDEHYHLKCTKCGKLIHLSCDYLSGMSEHILKNHGFVVNSSRTVFYGICRECRASGGGDDAQ